MPYVKKNALVRSRRSMMGFGDFNDVSLCSSIPSGDPYRKPGNYCNTGDGGYTTFNADGTVYQVPVASPPSTVSKILTALFPPTPVMPTAPIAPGMSTTTKLAIAGGAVLLAVVILRR